MNIHDVHGWIATRYRPRRMRVLFDRFALTPRSRVLDIGGSLDIWLYAPVLPHLTLLNVYGRPDGLPANVEWVEGDARALPFAPSDFDFIFSNSVIEHVGEWEDQRAMADEVRRLQTPYWIQTPNYRFPVEPHLLGLGVQFLPDNWQAPYARIASLRGLLGGREAVEDMLRHTHLLTGDDMRVLFPDAQFWHERVFGLTKSISAYTLTSSTLAPAKMEPAADAPVMT